MKGLVLASTIVLAGCSSHEHRRQLGVMDRIEGAVRLPSGAHPLNAYARYYARLPTGDVEGVYIIPWNDEPKPGEVCEELTASFSSHAVRCPKAQNDELKSGERGWVGDYQKLPVRLDGGCSVITIQFDPAKSRLKSVECNGEA